MNNNLTEQEMKLIFLIILIGVIIYILTKKDPPSSGNLMYN